MTHYQNYIFGAPFKIVMDQKALLSCFSEKNSKTTQTRLVVWFDRLLPFDCEIVHIPGKNMGLVDYLSRHPVGDAPKVSQGTINLL